MKAGAGKRELEDQGMTLEAVLKRDRAVVMSGLAGIAALAWVYMLYLAWGMKAMDMAAEMAMPQMQPWQVVDLLLLFVMWAVMMVAMMVPSVAPMVLMFAALNRRPHGDESLFVPTGAFLLGYLAVWTGFSALATLAQWGLHTAALVSPMMVTTSPILGGVLILAAGVFQWTPLKYACLKHCRSPLGFFMSEWRDGTKGALIMGLRHGIFCVGCCWTLMSLLFVAGVMNLLWVAAITVFVLLEKVAPGGWWLNRVSGALLTGWGVLMAARALG